MAQVDAKYANLKKTAKNLDRMVKVPCSEPFAGTGWNKRGIRGVVNNVISG
jgi:hypothetical protein